MKTTNARILTNQYGTVLRTDFLDYLGIIYFDDEIDITTQVQEIKRACEEWLSNHPEELSR